MVRRVREGTMSIASMKVPALLATGIICFAAGIGAGAVGLSIYGDRWGLLPKGKAEREEKEGDKEADNAAPNPAGRGQGRGGMGRGGMGGMGRGGMGRGGMGRGGMGRGGRGGFTPNPKNQLVALVTKLDQLTGKPLALNLNDEQKKTLREQLDSLQKQKELTGEEAEKRFKEILKVIEGEKA